MTQTAEPIAPPAFTVHDLETLTWFIRKLAAISSEQDRVYQQAERITADLERDGDGLRFQFGTRAEQTARRLMLERGGRAKHIKTLFGDAGLRRTPSRLSITSGERHRSARSGITCSSPSSSAKIGSARADSGSLPV